MKRYVIIVAGGTGSRMNSATPKQFLMLGNAPVIIHTIKRFVEFDSNMGVVVVIHADYVAELKELLNKYNLNQVKFCEGGTTRFHSVKNGLNCIEETHHVVVGVHDAARPLVSKDTLERCYALAAEKGNAVPVLEVTESIRQVKGSESHSMNRNDFRIVQTPQCFILDKALPAYEQTYSDLFTDDAAVLESAGQCIYLTEGNAENIKITHPKDIRIAEVLLTIRMF